LATNSAFTIRDALFPDLSEILAFVGGTGLFVLSFTGTAISLFPMIVPPHFTLWQAASSDRTQAFLFVGTPVILMYTSCSH
jgi:cytochrome d ubiquinol oxidase subunit II